MNNCRRVAHSQHLHSSYRAAPLWLTPLRPLGSLGGIRLSLPPPASLHSRLRSLYLRQATKSCVPFGLTWGLQSSLPAHWVWPAACRQPSYPSEGALATLQAALSIAYRRVQVKLLQMFTNGKWMLLPLHLVPFPRTVENHCSIFFKLWQLLVKTAATVTL